MGESNDTHVEYHWSDFLKTAKKKGKGVPTPSNGRSLTLRQRRFVEALATSKTVTEAGRKAEYAPATIDNARQNNLIPERLIPRLPRTEIPTYTRLKTKSLIRIDRTISDSNNPSGDPLAIQFLKVSSEHGLEDPAPPTDTGHVEALRVIRSVYLSACRHMRAGRIPSWAARELGVDAHDPKLPEAKA